MHAVLEDLQLVGLAHEGREAGPDLALAGGRHFVVVDLDDQAHLLHRESHRGAQVLQRVDGGHGEVAALDLGPVSDVAVLEGAAGAPGPFFGIDAEERAAHIVVPPYAVEHEELRLRPEVGGVRDPGGLQIGLGAPGEAARIASVARHRARFENVAAQDQSRLVGEGIEHRALGIRHEDHVRFLDASPAGDGRAVEHLAVLEEILVDL